MRTFVGLAELKSVLTLVLTSVLASGGALAQPNKGGVTASPAASTGFGATTANSPIDVTSEGTDVYQPQRLVVFKGNVEATQDQARLRTPELRIFYKAKPAPAPGAPAPSASNPADQMGSLDHIEAAGPVYYITPTQNARGDHGLYEADPNTITLTGNVVLVQGKSVGKGDKLVINRNTGESNLTSNNPKAPTARVRVVLYPQQPANGAPASAGQGGGARTATPAKSS